MNLYPIWSRGCGEMALDGQTKQRLYARPSESTKKDHLTNKALSHQNMTTSKMGVVLQETTPAGI